MGSIQCEGSATNSPTHTNRWNSNKGEGADLCRQLKANYQPTTLRERYLIYLRTVGFNLMHS